MSRVFDFFVAFGALVFWVGVASFLALCVPFIFRRLMDRLLPLEPTHGGYVPREVHARVREPMVTPGAEDLECWPVLSREPRR